MILYTVIQEQIISNFTIICVKISTFSRSKLDWSVGFFVKILQSIQVSFKDTELLMSASNVTGANHSRQTYIYSPVTPKVQSTLQLPSLAL